MSNEINLDNVAGVAGDPRPYTDTDEIEVGDLVRTNARRIFRKQYIKMRPDGYAYAITTKDRLDADGDLWANFEVTPSHPSTYDNSYVDFGDVELVAKVDNHSVEKRDWSGLDDLL